MSRKALNDNSYGLQQGKNYYFDINEGYSRAVDPNAEYGGGGGSKHYLMREDGELVFGWGAGQV